MTASRRRVFAGILGFTLVSRAIGFLREAIIALGFGFSRATDAFYQLAATPTYLVIYVGGPFSTAYIAWSNRADAPDERLRVGLVLRGLLAATFLLAACFVAVVMWLEMTHPGRRPQLLPGLLMALACLALALVGMGAAVANARAHFVQAQALLFVNNCGFVALLAISALWLRHSPELALTSAFAAAALIAALFGWRMIHQSLPPLRSFAAAERAEAALSLRRVFLPLLGMASSETAGFLASQAAVLVLAAMSGAGVTSAGSLAQRIALTANGLVVGPLANVAMVRLAKLEPEAARRYLLRTAILTLGGLSLAAALLSLGAKFVATRSHSANVALLAGLIPAYSVWLIAQGANIVVNRLSFARGVARLYTGATLASYVLATLARYLVWRSFGFGPAIAIGAAVELTATVVILIGIAASRAPGLANAGLVP